MSITAHQIITEALQLVGVIGGAETASGADAESCLFTLNMMLDGWNAQRLFVFTIQDHVSSGFSGGSLTIGPGGQLDTARPIKLENTCVARLNGIDYPLRIIDGETYSAITMKGLISTFPNVIYYDAQAPIGTAYVWPAPNYAVDLHLRMQQQINGFATTSAAVDLPPGYQEAITYSLAERLYIKFNRKIDAGVVRLAGHARRDIKRANNPVRSLQIPGALSGRGGRFNIYTGLPG